MTHWWSAFVRLAGWIVTVIGIAARNGIMLVSHYRHLEREESVLFGRDLALRGADERLAPIALTALVPALALLPLVLWGNQPGHEIEHPMAIGALSSRQTRCCDKRHFGG